MTINRHNYEEFFILYLDNELSSVDRRQVELFVQQHPDLGEELQLLQQTRLDSDTSIVFEGKESLMMLPSLELINSGNYEEWLVQYIDNELNDEQNASVEVYAGSHPKAGAALDILLKTKLQPENSITFFNKESLYRKEEAPVRRIVPVMWWRVAAAVLLLIALTVGGFTFFRNNSTTPVKGLAGTKDIRKNTAPPKMNERKETVEGQSTLAQNNPDQVRKEQGVKQKDNQTAIPKQTDNIARVIRKNVEENQPEKQLADIDEGNRNNLPIARVDIKNTPKTPELAAATLTIPQGNTLKPLVTSGTTQSFIQAKNTLTNDEEVAVNEPENKTKFRGLLRKITRTFEKTTNIKATDEEDRLLVAGLSIRL